MGRWLMQYDLKRLAWLLALSETIHNLEEALWLPAWSKSAGPWHEPVGAFEFRFAVIVITLIVYAVIWYFSRCDNRIASGMMGGILVVILVNVFFPHLIASIACMEYVPGLLTGILLNLPVTIYLLRRGVCEDFFNTRILVIGTAGMAVITIPLLPVLFALGRWIAVL